MFINATLSLSPFSLFDARTHTLTSRRHTYTTPDAHTRVRTYAQNLDTRLRRVRDDDQRLPWILRVVRGAVERGDHAYESQPSDNSRWPMLQHHGNGGCKRSISQFPARQRTRLEVARASCHSATAESTRRDNVEHETYLFRHKIK